MTRLWRCEQSIPAETTAPSRSQRMNRTFFPQMMRLKAESVLIGKLIRGVQEALASSVITVDGIPLLHFSIPEVAKRVALCVELELDEQLHMKERGHWGGRIKVFALGRRVVFRECDVRFERCLWIHTISSELRYKVGTRFICNGNLCG